VKSRPRYASRYSAFSAAQKATRAARASANRVAAASVNVAMRGLQLEKGEFKAVDANGSSVIDSTGALVLLNGLARGDEINERNGREVVMKSVQINFGVQCTITTGTDQYARVLLVYDRQSNGAAPAITDILVSNNTTAVRNLENRRRFKILMDRRYTLNQASEAGSKISDSFYRRLRHPITFNSGDAGTVADITTGSLYLVTMGSNAAGATAGSCLYYSRVRFQDH